MSVMVMLRCGCTGVLMAWSNYLSSVCFFYYFLLLFFFFFLLFVIMYSLKANISIPFIAYHFSLLLLLFNVIILQMSNYPQFISSIFFLILQRSSYIFALFIFFYFFHLPSLFFEGPVMSCLSLSTLPYPFLHCYLPAV